MNTFMMIGLRNISRNRRRTWLTAGGIAFAIWLVGVSVALQDGQYAMQRRTATDLLTGHVQVSRPDWPAHAGIEYLVDDVAGVTAALAPLPGVTGVLPRLQFFAMAAAGENSVAAQVIGLEFDLEKDHSTVVKRITAGRLPAAAGEVLAGESLARMLGAGVGSELDVLAPDPAGGMAALSVRIAGLLRTGVPELDRVLLLVSWQAAAEALSVPGQAHVIVVRGLRPETAPDLAERIRAVVSKDLLVRPWQDVMPEIEEAIELDRLGGYPFYGVILFLVTFSVANTFVMVIFERTREFGMLRSLGMQPLGIIGLLQFESLALWGVGTVTGLVVLLLSITFLATVGISLGQGLEAMLSQMYMPTRIHGDFSARALVAAPLVLLVSTQLAALLPAMRIRRIQPAQAMRMGA